MNKPGYIIAESPDQITVQLATPTEVNGVAVDRLTLRAPTVLDSRAARKVGGDDDERTELVLFANLAGCGPGDLERMRLKDYTRVQDAYFRLLADDAGHQRGDAPAAPAPAVGAGNPAE